MASKDIFNRTELLLGPDVMEALSQKRVIVFGVGGVGSWCVEGLVRSGISDITIVDSDVVGVTNVNRQLMATSSTVGRVKVEALKERLLEINPEVRVEAVHKAFNEETVGEFDFDSYDYVIDAVDSLKDKILLLLTVSGSKAKLFSSMGAALKVDPTKVKVDEFWQVRGCPLGAAIRKKMRRENTFPSKDFLCVYGDEVLPNRGDPSLQGKEADTRKAVVNGTTAHVTAIFGMTLAGLVIKDIYSTVVK